MVSLLLLGALSALPLSHAHMQMMKPSPFRDPHANRPNEPKDYDILQPLHADGSDFACKGYHLNTPWTPTAEYEAGGTYQMQLEGSATHGGGSCQLSMSFDGGKVFKVIKSMEGGCPETKQWDFTVPKELAQSSNKKTTGLFAWTWFNKIGNREMYMNCAPVNIVPKGSHDKRKREIEWETLEARDVQKVNTAAQSALSSYPSLFVANLKSINDCVTKETQDVIFDAPGNDVAFADGKSRSVAASFGDGKCTGKGGDSAGSSSSSSSSSPPPPSGNNGQWNSGSPSQPSSSQSSLPSSCANVGDGQWHPECYSGQKASSDTSTPVKPVSKKVSAPQAPSQQTAQDAITGTQPSTKVEKELDGYSTGLYSDSKTKRTICTEAKKEPCASPYRWVKRDACTWTCERKGRRAQLTPSMTTAPTAQAADLEAELRSIESAIAHVMDLASKKQQISIHRRESNNATDTANSTLSEPESSNSFDTFLTYLSRLQTTVVDCIRNIAATTPSNSPVPVVEFVAARPSVKDMSMSDKVKRQLVVPSLSSIISAMKIDSNDPLYAALNDLGADLAKVGELVGEKVGSGDVEGGLSALVSAVDSALTIANTTTLPLLLNATMGDTNSTTDDLQNATDLTAVDSAPAITNTTTLPVLLNATIGDANSTTNDLQNATDLTAVDSVPAITNTTALPVLLNATIGDINSTTNDLQNATDLTAVDSAPAIANATTLPFLQNATTVDTNLTTNNLQNATNLTAVDSALALVNATTLPFLQNATTVDTNSTTNDLQNAADLAAALSLDENANTPPPSFSLSPTTTPTPKIDPSTAILPYLLGGLGPVIAKPGAVFSLPGPDAPLSSALLPTAPLQSPGVGNLEHFPKVVDDLGEGSEGDVRKFFEGLKDGDSGDEDEE